MVKNTFRLPEDIEAKLSELAEKKHKGQKTATVLEALERYYKSEFGEVIGWVSVRLNNNKARCAKCNGQIDSPGFVKLEKGFLGSDLYCSKCAK